jgi:hypothetical protein
VLSTGCANRKILPQAYTAPAHDVCILSNGDFPQWTKPSKSC